MNPVVIFGAAILLAVGFVDSVIAQPAVSAHWYETFVDHLTDWLLALFNGLLVLFTWRLARATMGLQAAAARQATDTQHSIAEATRAATAMEAIAEATRNNALLMQTILHKQMRAYLAVDLGQAIAQGAGVRFEADPILNNTGFTPARNVSFKVMADVLDTNLPRDFPFPDFAGWQINDASLGPRQTFNIHGIVRNRYEEGEVDVIMKGEHRSLYVWGTVTYDDVFGGSWQTDFCHRYVFAKGDEGVRWLGFIHHSHNKAT